MANESMKWSKYDGAIGGWIGSAPSSYADIYLYEGANRFNYPDLYGVAVNSVPIPDGLSLEEAMRYAETIWRMSQ